MGSVYVAEQLTMKRMVAIKVIRSGSPEAPEQKEMIFRRFRREALAASMQEHPNTVRVYDSGKTKEGALYLAMEMLKGRTLMDKKHFALAVEDFRAAYAMCPDAHIRRYLGRAYEGLARWQNHVSYGCGLSLRTDDKNEGKIRATG